MPTTATATTIPTKSSSSKPRGNREPGRRSDRDPNPNPNRDREELIAHRTAGLTTTTTTTSGHPAAIAARALYSDLLTNTKTTSTSTSTSTSTGVSVSSTSSSNPNQGWTIPLLRAAVKLRVTLQAHKADAGAAQAHEALVAHVDVRQRKMEDALRKACEALGLPRDRVTSAEGLWEAVLEGEGGGGGDVGRPSTTSASDDHHHHHHHHHHHDLWVRLEKGARSAPGVAVRGERRGSWSRSSSPPPALARP